MGLACSGATGKDWMFSRGHSHAAESKSYEEKADVQEARPGGTSISPGTVCPWSTEELGAAHSQVQLGVTAKEQAFPCLFLMLCHLGAVPSTWA